ncbi:uncharacterized protein FIBRA_00178 [Fibroporia radiculosa]|uniref:RBR-type E3 ubiquitin transferase n=1 Tax=Fibroporia radiculosa TaxID=599839 RepID=J7S5S1_9APHY|nr:uncharacterized protein FIBRA_00178 [Fibroporia radiculosa]CCL98184.1 predicted protein [Fibroporia radiculosa]
MSSNDEYSDDEVAYYDEDDEMMDDEDDGSASDMELDQLHDPSRPPTKIYEVEYQSLSQSEVEKLISSDIEYISSVFGVDPDEASLMLRWINWNREKLTEKFMDNASVVSIAAGIALPEKAPERAASPSGRSQPPISSSSRATIGPFRNSRRVTPEQPKSGKTRILERLTPPVEDSKPVICAVARMWLQKCRDDSETANWIKSNTKECSKCQSTIEKNGGCNHMTCKKCKYEFCWVCMGPWSEHGTSWYNCNRYDEKASVDARDAQSKSRASLERYLHYYNRWANHEQSKKLSVELYAKTEKKMEEMQVTSELSWIEVQFMKKAVDEVIKCRTTLMWTYGMAYYLERGNEKELFEDNQRDLERAVEELSELIESPFDPEVIKALRQKVTDKTVYVQKRNEIVLEDTAKGFTDGRWTWNMPVEGFD